MLRRAEPLVLLRLRQRVVGAVEPRNLPPDLRLRQVVLRRLVLRLRLVPVVRALQLGLPGLVEDAGEGALVDEPHREGVGVRRALRELDQDAFAHPAQVRLAVEALLRLRHHQSPREVHAVHRHVRRERVGQHRDDAFADVVEHAHRLRVEVVRLLQPLVRLVVLGLGLLAEQRREIEQDGGALEVGVLLRLLLPGVVRVGPGEGDLDVLLRDGHARVQRLQRLAVLEQLVARRLAATVTHAARLVPQRVELGERVVAGVRVLGAAVGRDLRVDRLHEVHLLARALLELEREHPPCSRAEVKAFGGSSGWARRVALSAAN